MGRGVLIGMTVGFVMWLALWWAVVQTLRWWAGA